MVKTIITIFLMLFFVPLSLMPETIVLKDGKTIRGTILPGSLEHIRIRTEEELLTIPVSMVKYIQYGENPSALSNEALDLYRQRYLQIHSEDINERINLAKFCLDQGLYPQAIQETKRLISQLPSELEQIKNLLKQAEIAHFTSLIQKAQWWTKHANNYHRALLCLEEAKAAYPDLAQKQKILFDYVDNQIHNQQIIEKNKNHFSSHESDNFTYFYPVTFNIKPWIKFCEEKRTLLYQMLALGHTPKWQPKCQIIIFPNHNAYLQSSKGLDWTLARTVIIANKEINHPLYIKERMICCFNLPKEQFEIVLAHEIAHVLLHEILGITARIPLWISEGFSDYAFEHKHEGLITTPPTHIINDETDYPANKAAFYSASDQWVQKLIDLGGMESFMKFAFLISTGYSFDHAFLRTYPQHGDKLKQWNISDDELTTR
ncbi:MAG: hypothetical protein Q8Q33_05600 [Chlamydiota bacterium]|nr:hypothetical protein [Chlamydiota bacterium]